MNRILDYLKRQSLERIALVGLILNLIGPALSFYSIRFQLNLPKETAYLYSVSTYILDLIVVVVFSYLLTIFLKTSFIYNLKLVFIMHYPIWIFDIVDIYQPIRFLSTFGLVLGLFVLYRLLSVDKKKFLVIMFFYIAFYTLDAVLAEKIATNPLLKKLMEV